MVYSFSDCDALKVRTDLKIKDPNQIIIFLFLYKNTCFWQLKRSVYSILLLSRHAKKPIL